MASKTMASIVLAPVAFVRALGLTLLIGYAALIGLIVFFGHEHDVALAVASQDIARSALGATGDKMARMARDESWWNEAVTHLTGKIDPAWTDANIGAYQAADSEFAEGFVVDASDRTAVAYRNGKAVQLDALASLSGGIKQLIERTRRSPPQTVEPASGLFLAEGKPSIVAVSAITPELGSPMFRAPY